MTRYEAIERVPSGVVANWRETVKIALVCAHRCRKLGRGITLLVFFPTRTSRIGVIRIVKNFTSVIGVVYEFVSVLILNLNRARGRTQLVDRLTY
jgi:hypothetical protein